MKNENLQILKIYLLNQPILKTEWYSLLGSKYCDSLPFKFELVDSMDEANVVAWDGVFSAKLEEKIPFDKLKDKLLILVGDSRSFFKNHPFVKLIDPRQYNCIELSSWNVLPEELLMALDQCYKKISNV
ncbi:MAG: hypothetical protein AB7I27_03215 [Bacteriovoracaceae bacterium]